jgi:hypothetical protein
MSLWLLAYDAHGLVHASWHADVGPLIAMHGFRYVLALELYTQYLRQGGRL